RQPFSRRTGAYFQTVAGAKKVSVPDFSTFSQLLTLTLGLCQVTRQTVHLLARLRRQVDVLHWIVFQIEQERLDWPRRSRLVQSLRSGLGVEAADQLIAAVVHHAAFPRSTADRGGMHPCLAVVEAFHRVSV